MLPSWIRQDLFRHSGPPSVSANYGLQPSAVPRTVSAMFKLRLTYANVAATLALVFSMTGGALAAQHYLITSTKQISPKVIKALKGKNGKTGPQGPQGKEGLAGKEGAPGKEGALGKEGKQGTPGSALAYAHVESNGTIDATNTSSNITNANISHISGSNYNFTGLPFTVHSVTVTLGFGVGVNDDVYGAVLGSHEAGVAAYTSAGAETNDNFYIVFN